MTDDELMAAALVAADTARFDVAPRPWVGAALAALDGTVVTGATTGRTGPHAEVAALEAAASAGVDVVGATMAVTLEPCAHHGVTPPCAEALVAAGVARVVVALEDPDERVAGRGIEILRAADVEVVVGVGATTAALQLAPYLHHRRTGRPLVVLKLALSLDGRTAAPDGSSQWITGSEARLDAHRLRASSDAILVGAGTVRADDPALTVRLPAAEPGAGAEPLRVVLGTAPADAAVRPCVEVGGDLGVVLDDLGTRGVLQVLVEGGAAVAHAFHAAGLVDRYVVYLAPCLFGGDDARGAFAGPGVASIADVWRGRIVDVHRLGADLRLDLLADRPGA